MSAGRCAGCGKVSQSCKVIKNHIIGCPDWKALYLRDPARALEPEAEYRRWQDEDVDAEREDRKAQASAEAAQQRAAMADRFRTPPDPLEE